jgi:putative Mg2+ transporter-C (MgtC) family protein
MDSFWTELGVSAPDWIQWGRIAVRLGVAVLLAGLVGLERELRGEQAGLRTHMLVSLGAALFTLVPLEMAPGVDSAELVKGIAAGVGFLGAGAILKRTDEAEIHGLTTAASIWATAAIGMAAGAGWVGAALIATVMCWLILRVLRAVDNYLERRRPSR